MNDIIINTEEDEVEIDEAYSVDYDLPIASASTLGGIKIGDNVDIDNEGIISVPVASVDQAGVIKVGTNLSIDENGVMSATGGASVNVDSALSTSSTNPVQNRVITNNLNSAVGDISNLQSDISSINGEIDDIDEAISGLTSSVGLNSDAITTLQDDVTANSGLIANNASDILSIQGDVSTLNTNLGNLSGDVTALGNTVSQMGLVVDSLSADTNETIAYDDISNYWTAGNVFIVGKGKIAYVNFDLEGSLTINGGSYENILEITDDDFKPKYLMEGFLFTDAGMLKVSAFTSGIFRAYNLSSSNITLTKLSGNIPIILN